ncbi:MAM domain-containing glycosylphosphatidylinositol anchor protein 1 [Microcaecilia unicolor]|uniref:MAM domain-containing glycosylphosphatidylinositol anchor protein 1-like n=2 Tax=Amphibia TaxID=8292 RepID=A0A6P7XXB2_9AMPH|nr:MAM domain-containing glycosylphosphatidylinositol anchor protein 1-like [Microcaecilia unicolor]
MQIVSLLLLALLPRCPRAQGVYAPAQAQIIHAGQACVVKEDNISERVYTIREGDVLVLQCLVTGHPRPQVRWTKTAGSASDKFQETSIFNETLRIENIQRMQGGRYYCKAENGVGVPAIKSIRVDVQYLDEPILTVHQTISDVRGSFYQEKTVFLRCTVNSNPPARFIWKRGAETLSHNQDNGVDIYEPLYTQGETKVLKVKNLRPQDYASYSCQVSVRNVCGIPDKSITFQLTNNTGAARARRSGENRVYRSKNANQSPLSSKAETAPPSLKMSVNETLVVNPGDNVTIQCSLTGGDPTPQVIWSHSPNPMPQNSFTQGGNLTIWRIRTEDSGYYNCTAINNVGNPAKKMVNILVRSMKNITFQITPDLIKESESIQLGQDLKLSCHVDAVPQEKVVYSWYKNGKPAKISDRLLITRNDPELPAITSSLEIIDLRFSDYGTYLCVASFQGAPIPDLSVEVNISSETVPPTISVPKGQSIITVQEGSRAELQCEVRGKPRPPILWSRVDKEAPMPSGAMVVETYDGKLQLDNVNRELSGTYKCQTARYNGFNIRPREALVQLNVQFPPVVEPTLEDIRQGLGRSVVMRCTMLKGSPMKVATAIWRFNKNLLTVPLLEQLEYSELKIDSLSREASGTYECSISNHVGSSTCVFQVSGRAYSPEFYFDTPNPVKAQKQSKNYSYVLQWTQREPDAVDPVTSYRLDIQQVNVRSFCPLIREVMGNPMIQGVRVGSHIFKIAAFADDLLVHLVNPRESLDTLLETFREYGDYAGFRINLNKSEALASQAVNRGDWGPDFPLRWATDSLKYLGTRLTMNTSDLYHLNVEVLLDHTRDKLDSWMNLPLSLMGRVHPIQMVLFPRWLYVLQTLPIHLLQKDLRRVTRLFSRFCWAGKKPKFSQDMLVGSWKQGGIGFPDLFLYNQACLLRHLGDVFNVTQYYTPLTLEQAFFAPYEVMALIHLPRSLIPSKFKKSILLQSLREAWQWWMRQMGGHPHITDQIPIVGNPVFAAGLDNPAFGNWRGLGITRLEHLLLESGEIITFDALQEKVGATWGNRFAYAQIAHYMKSLDQTTLKGRMGETIRGFLEELRTERYSVSGLYGALVRRRPKRQYDGLKHKWEQDLGSSLASWDVAATLKGIRTLVQDERLRECGYRVVLRGYMSKAQLAHVLGPGSSACSKCGGGPSSYYHALWQCPKVRAFWQRVKGFLIRLGNKIQGTERQFLLDQPRAFAPLRAPAIKLCRKLSLVARKCIMQYWTSPDEPAYWHWRNQVHLLASWEARDSKQSPKRRAQFIQIWMPYLQNLSPRGRSLLLNA